MVNSMVIIARMIVALTLFVMVFGTVGFIENYESTGTEYASK